MELLILVLLTLVSFFITIGVEEIIGFISGLRSWRLFRGILFVNLFSFPLFNIWNYFLFMNISQNLFILNLLIGEIIVILAEGYLLSYALPEHKRYKLFLLSFIMNGVTTFLGIMLFMQAI